MEAVLIWFEQLSAMFLSFLQQEIFYTLIIFIPIYILSTLLKKRFPYLQFGLWTLIFVRLVLPTDLSLPISLQNLAGNTPFISLTSTTFYSIFTQDKNLHSDEILPVFIDFENSKLLENEVLSHDEPANGNQIQFSWKSVLFFLWLAGFLIFAGIYWKRLFRFRTLIKSSWVISIPGLQIIVKNWRQHFNIERNVRLVSSGDFLSPFTIGVINPVIYLPEMVLKNADFKTIETIIAHEMAHIKRFDSFWIKLQNIIQLTYFFYPVTWYANSQINAARERICDRLVLEKNIISPVHYGNSMVKVLKMNLIGMEGIGFLPSFGNQRKKFQQRLAEIKGGQPMKLQNRVTANLIIILLGLFVLPMSCHQENSEPVADEQTASEIKPVRLVEDTGIEITSPLKEGTITATFGNVIRSSDQIVQFHRGIDIAAERGSDIFAAAEGIVLFAAKNGGYGKKITIQHDNGLKTIYAHLDTILIEKGQIVNASEKIGKVGSTGLSKFPHLHFELFKDDELQNPENYITFDSFPRKTTGELHHQTKGQDSESIALYSPITEGYISSAYGNRKHPVEKDVRFHKGIDIAAQKGTEIYATADGIVRFAQEKGNYGLLVDLAHRGAYTSRYAQMDTILVKEDQLVKAGDLIGLVGSSGVSTAPHLHFELRKSDKPLNPENFIDFSSLQN